MPNRTKSNDAAFDAIDLLTTDHKEVKTLFKQYDKLVESDGSEEEKQTLAGQICQMLTVHATLEEELFYPAAREALGEDADLVRRGHLRVDCHRQERASPQCLALHMSTDLVGLDLRENRAFMRLAAR